MVIRDLWVKKYSKLLDDNNFKWYDNRNTQKGNGKGVR